MMEQPETTGQRIRDAREHHGYTLRELGFAVGVKYQAVQQWEKDVTLPATKQLPAIEDALELEPGTLSRWVRQSPIYLATLTSAPNGATPGLRSEVVAITDLLAQLDHLKLAC